MKKKLLIVTFFIAMLLSSDFVFAQYGLFLSGNPYIKLSNGSSTSPVFLIIKQTATTGIVGFGNIISEGEFNYLDWVIGTGGPGTYNIPFYDPNSSENIPFSMTIGNAATGAGYVLFSTYHAPGARTPFASYEGTAGTAIQYLNLQNTAPNSNNDTANVVERWWIVDAESYSGSYGSFANMPSNISFTFNFSPSEMHNITNLEAQPFEYGGSVATTMWNPSIVFPGTYTPGTTETFVNSATVLSTNLYRAWILVNSTSPLPIELLSFNAVCQGNNVGINWSTASETNNDYFTIERSKDGKTWETVTIVPGAGNSNSTLSYSYTENNPFPITSYYRLKQTDYNGQSETFNSVAVNCSDEITYQFNIFNINTNVSNNEMFITYTSPIGKRVTAGLFNVIGQQLGMQQQVSSAETNTIKFSNCNFNRGVYLIRLDNGDNVIMRKIIIP